MNGEWTRKDIPILEKLFAEAMENEEHLFQDKFKHATMINPIAIEKIPFIEYPDLSFDECKDLQELAQRLLTVAMELNNSREVSLTYRLDKENFQSDEDRVAITLGSEHEVDVHLDPKTDHLFQSAQDVVIVNMHNHPSNSTFSLNDISFFLDESKIKLFVLLSNKGNIEYLARTKSYNRGTSVKILKASVREIAHDKIDKHGNLRTESLSIKQRILIAKTVMERLVSKKQIVYRHAKDAPLTLENKKEWSR